MKAIATVTNNMGGGQHVILGHPTLDLDLGTQLYVPGSPWKYPEKKEFPESGKTVIVYLPTSVPGICEHAEGHFNERDNCWYVKRHFNARPTRWMEIPEEASGKEIQN